MFIHIDKIIRIINYTVDHNYKDGAINKSCISKNKIYRIKIVVKLMFVLVQKVQEVNFCAFGWKKVHGDISLCQWVGP
jgi:hypothetical protein